MPLCSNANVRVDLSTGARILVAALWIFARVANLPDAVRTLACACTLVGVARFYHVQAAQCCQRPRA
eukprot:6779467-Alexandrium_andersonii.AAC.1